MLRLSGFQSFAFDLLTLVTVFSIWSCVWETINGNAADHMNIPINPAQMASAGSKELGYTEMKGSWFIFDTYRAHEDWCRWRAPSWHFTRILDSHSHANYHLGFRCCKTLK